MKNVLKTLQSDLLFDIETNVRSKISIIIEELRVGRTDSLHVMSYIVCGDPTAMKVYEIESYLINEELSLLNQSQLSLLWLATEEGSGYEDTNLNELPYDGYDVFNYVYNHINLYDSQDFSENDFLELLDRQCWLQTTVSECEIAYQKLHDEVINNIQYNDFNVLVPSFVDSIEDIQFYYIYGTGVNSLTFKEYERHILYKVINLIKKERMGKSFFRELSSSYEGFDLYWDNYEFYSILPPIYFAQKIMETDEFRFPLDFHIDKEIEFINLDSKQIKNIVKDNDEEINDVISQILETTIFDINNYGSEEYNRLVYNNSDQRYDHDLSRFLQYTYTLNSSDEDGIRLQTYTALKKELEDEHNTIRSEIEDFIIKEFPEYGKTKKPIVNTLKPYNHFNNTSDVIINKQKVDNVQKNKIRLELFSILSEYISLDEKSFSFSENLKSLFPDNTDTYLERVHQLNNLSNQLSALNARLDEEGNAKYYVVHEYINSLQKTIIQLSTIQNKLYKKSNHKMIYSKVTYNDDYSSYLKYKEKYLSYATEVNNFFKEPFNVSDSKKYPLDAVTPNKEKKDTFSAVKPHIPFPDYLEPSKKIKNESISKGKNDLKYVIKNYLLIPILYAYLMGAGISATYFNWQFSKDNGFFKWAMLGQIVPTMKSIIWPYYTSQYFLSKSPSNEITLSFSTEEDAFIQSMSLWNKATKMMNIASSGNKGSMNKNEYKVFLDLLRKSLSESKKVSDQTLKGMDSMLTFHYRNEFQKGLMLYIEGLTDGNNEMFHEGRKYLDKFGEWFNTFPKNKI